MSLAGNNTLLSTQMYLVMVFTFFSVNPEETWDQASGLGGVTPKAFAASGLVEESASNSLGGAQVTADFEMELVVLEI